MSSESVKGRRGPENKYTAKPVLLRLTPELRARLDRAAAQSIHTRPTLTRIALERFLDEIEAGR